MLKKVFANQILILMFLFFSYSFSQQQQTGTKTDQDGDVYQTVKIGDQWWMAENLKVTHYRNGDPIPYITDNTQWTNLSTGALYAYNNDSDQVFEYVYQ